MAQPPKSGPYQLAHDKDGVVASPAPGVGVGGGEQCFGFGSGEERDGGPVGPFLGDCEDALDRLGVFGVLVGRVFVERSDRGEAGVAGGGAVVPFGFEVVENPPMRAASSWPMSRSEALVLVWLVV